MIKEGKFNKYIRRYGDRNNDACKEDSKFKKKDDDVDRDNQGRGKKDHYNNKPTKATIHHIANKVTSERGKEHVAPGSSIAHRTSGLIVDVVIARHKVEKLLLDTGEPSSILYQSTVERMMLDKTRIKPHHHQIKGPGNKPLPIVGEVVLPVTFIDGENKEVTKMIKLKIIDSPVTYNGLIGFYTMQEFDICIRPKTLKITFPTKDRMAIISLSILETILAISWLHHPDNLDMRT